MADVITSQKIISLGTLSYNNDKMKEYIQEEIDKIPSSAVDDSLSDTSEHPVQNKVIKAALDEKINVSDVSEVAKTGSYNDLSDRPSVMKPESHTHSQSDITGLTTELNTKSDVGHKHTKSEITDFPSSLPADGGNADTVDGNSPTDLMNLECSYINLSIIPDNTDIDSIVNAGKYAISNGTSAATMTNSAFTSSGYYLDVFKRDSKLITQIAMSWDGIIKIRSTTNGLFSSWKVINDGGEADAAKILATSRTIDGMSFNGSANITHYAICSTDAATVVKVVSLTDFILATGAKIAVKFTKTNTASNPTLNVNNTGAKPIYYRGSAISDGCLGANRTYEFIYNGAQYELVGDLDTNTDTKVTTVDNHYTPSGGTTTSASGGTLTDITNSDSGVQVVTGVTKDTAGHVTGVTSVALKSTNTNTDTNVAQTNTTTSADYRLLLSTTADDTTRTEGARKSTKFKANPSTGVLTATTFSGTLSGNATSATNADKLDGLHSESFAQNLGTWSSGAIKDLVLAATNSGYVAISGSVTGMPMNGVFWYGFLDCNTTNRCLRVTSTGTIGLTYSISYNATAQAWYDWHNVADGGNAATANKSGTLAATASNICLRNLSSGTAAATWNSTNSTGNCPPGAWYGQHS